MSAVCCPRCTSLTLVPSHDVHVCTSCGGVWLDDGRARQLLGPLGSDLQSSSAPMTAPIECSWCRQVMGIWRSGRAGVEIDVCTSHGVWFDRHELERVSQVVSQALGQPVPQAPASWSQAHPPAGHVPMAEYGPAPGTGSTPSGTPTGTGAGWVAGAAAVGAVAAGAAAYAVYGNQQQPQATRSSSGVGDAVEASFDAVDLGEPAGGAVETAGELAGGAVEAAGELAGGAFEALGSVAEVGGDVAEAAGSVLGVVFEAIGGLFS